MVTIKALPFLISGATALAVLKRDFTSFISCLQLVDDKVNGFKNVMANYYGGITYAITISNDEKDLDSTVVKCTTQAKANGPVTTDEYPQLFAVVDRLAPDLQASLITSKTKKGFFIGDGVLPIFQTALAGFAADSIALATALASIVPDEDKGAANQRKEEIQAAFDDCINYYNISVDSY
ncbi:hypothetical protein BGZ60DRAFT_535307 [Tricladium varicosporioides]|nr:hypothetical protein BGZ60DRAFT_535307 [Hymenoscyphus varicosporioides]